MIKAFVTRRGQSPTGQETTRLPVTRAVVYNLHSGTARGLTWHEQADDLDVVWLLGVAWHEGDDSSDAYRVLKDRDANGLLLPTEDDYADLEPEPVQFITEAARQLPDMLARSRVMVDSEISERVAGVLEVAVMTRQVPIDGVQLTETWVAIRLPPTPGVVMPTDLVTFVLGALFPTLAPEDLRYEQAFPGHDPRNGNELVYSYLPFPT
ncbi:MAG: hypothetical protein ACYDAQ_02355 [Mycobacteriales bacterium]